MSAVFFVISIFNVVSVLGVGGVVAKIGFAKSKSSNIDINFLMFFIITFFLWMGKKYLKKTPIKNMGVGD